jgi:hypothetical protein
MKKDKGRFPICKYIDIKPELLNSQAWRKLIKAKKGNRTKGVVIEVLFYFLCSRQFQYNKIIKGYECINNGKIEIALSTLSKKLGYSKDTIIKARNLLIEVGFLEIAVKGGDNVRHKYKVCYEDGENKWKQYPHKDWKHLVPSMKDNQIGKRTRYPKKNTTLDVHTPISQNDPTHPDRLKDDSLNNGMDVKADKKANNTSKSMIDNTVRDNID